MKDFYEESPNFNTNNFIDSLIWLSYSDNEKKSMYDLQQQGGGTPFGFPGHQQPGQADFQDINNIFNMMFPGMGAQMHGMPGLRAATATPSPIAGGRARITRATRLFRPSTAPSATAPILS